MDMHCVIQLYKLLKQVNVICRQADVQPVVLHINAKP